MQGYSWVFWTCFFLQSQTTLFFLSFYSIEWWSRDKNFDWVLDCFGRVQNRLYRMKILKKWNKSNSVGWDRRVVKSYMRSFTYKESFLVDGGILQILSPPPLAFLTVYNLYWLLCLSFWAPAFMYEYTYSITVNSLSAYCI